MGDDPQHLVPFAYPLSITWDQAVISYRIERCGKVAAIDLDSKETLAESVEENSGGRLHLSNLAPAKTYRVKVSWKRGSATLAFRTLPKPRGRLLCSFAVLADPHESTRNENRKGRLFVESDMILRQIVSEINELGADFVLVAGDLTNDCQEGEFIRLKNVLPPLKCPFHAVPGDHDRNEKGLRLWRKYFGSPCWCLTKKNLVVHGLDTSQGCLGKKGRDSILEHYDENKTNIYLSHLQLFPDDYIRSAKHKAILDFEEHAPLFNNTFKTKSLLYIGHQNALSQARLKRALQLNLPQPVQYPCGYIYVRQFANGFYHTFMPIQSEVLNEYSRMASQEALRHYNEPQWQYQYRLGADSHQANFVY